MSEISAISAYRPRGIEALYPTPGSGASGRVEAVQPVTRVRPATDAETRYGVRLDISPEARARAAQEASLPGRSAEARQEGQPGKIADTSTQEQTDQQAATGETKANGEPLSQEEQQQVRQMKARDQEVRAHEQAHVAAGGNLVRGGPNYSYDTGPDGKRYITGGEVSIDTSPVDGDPEATLRKAQRIRSAALAPAQPSGQDRAVAASADSMAAQARRDMAAETQEQSTA